MESLIVLIAGVAIGLLVGIPIANMTIASGQRRIERDELKAHDAYLRGIREGYAKGVEDGIAKSRPEPRITILPPQPPRTFRVVWNSDGIQISPANGIPLLPKDEDLE